MECRKSAALGSERVMLETDWPLKREIQTGRKIRAASMSLSDENWFADFPASSVTERSLESGPLSIQEPKLEVKSVVRAEKM